MITFKKVKICFLFIFLFVNIFYIAPSYSLSSREDFFKKALDLYQQAIKLNLPEKYIDPDSYNILIPVNLNFEFYEQL